VRIILYKAPQKYLVHDFDKEELNDVMQIVKDLGVKYYVLVY